MPGICYSF